MKFTESDVNTFHRTLYRCCGLPQFRPGLYEINIWRDFLSIMTSIEETEGGPFNAADIEAVVSRMRRERDEGRAGWSLRPQKILRDPETFRDLVLMARKERHRRPRPKPVRKTITTGGTSTMVEHDPATQLVDREAFKRAMHEVKRNITGGPR